MSEKVEARGAIIRRSDLPSTAARELIEALNSVLSGRYPEEGATHFRLDPDEVTEGRGTFLSGYRNGIPVGCGAVRKIDERTGELKRMYVSPEERGRGLGRALLAALESEALALGLSRLVLETGVRQSEATALYRRAGFSEIPPFGEYLGSPLSLCMAKDLRGG